MRTISSLPAFGIAMILALAGLGVAPHAVTATDPAPTPTPATEPTPSPTPATEPTPSPSPEPTATPSPSPEPTADTGPTRAERLRDRYVRAARVAVRQRHDRYVPGGTGPNAFDCSGLVRYAYRQAGISGRLGGGHSARAMLDWARKHDKVRKRHPRVGDVVIWGNGRHAGIYVGKGRAISALNPRQGIRVLGIHQLGDPFTAFIRTRP